MSSYTTRQKPGVRPIGVGEVLRRIIGKTVTTFIKGDIINAADPFNFLLARRVVVKMLCTLLTKCLRRRRIVKLFYLLMPRTLLSLNRTTSLLNIQQIFPEFAVFIINTYREPAKLYLPGGKHILSNEGTTQRDNCASGFYSLSILLF